MFMTNNELSVMLVSIVKTVNGDKDGGCDLKRSMAINDAEQA